MRSTHRSNDQIRIDSRRPARCLRHHVWMAACDECRDARSTLATRPDDEASAS